MAGGSNVGKKSPIIYVQVADGKRNFFTGGVYMRRAQTREDGDWRSTIVGSCIL